jgi:hypothetical protein
LERGPLSLVSTTEELLGRNSSGSGLEIRKYGRRDLSRWPRGTLYPQKKLAPTSLTSGGRSVGIVSLWTEATEFFYFFIFIFFIYFFYLPYRSAVLEDKSVLSLELHSDKGNSDSWPWPTRVTGRPKWSYHVTRIIRFQPILVFSSINLSERITLDVAWDYTTTIATIVFEYVSHLVTQPEGKAVHE